jgi:imidazolonepropionase-like amidohydrolase
MLALVGGTILTVANGTVADGTILIDKGKIIAVGERVPLPVNTPTINTHGKIITPGLIDCHTHLGIAQEAVGDAKMDKTRCLIPYVPTLGLLTLLILKTKVCRTL